ncbi:MAG: Tol-Pal system beta propeller repeat protein TolB [Geobacter sp.]|nr:Tol-Pal system beta propeller repeat protein TolB [Geobacter sp.]
MIRLITVGLLLSLLLPGSAHPSEDFLRVMAAGNVALRLVIQPPLPASGAPDAKLADEIATIFKLDLGITGLFAMVDPAPQDKAAAVPGADADMVLKTVYTVSPASVTFEYRLQESVTGREILAKRYSAVRQDLRKTAHTFSDDILYALTGERGSFTGKLAYVSKAGGNKEIYIMDWDGFNPRKIIANGSINLNPDFSPSGKELIYTSYKNGNPDLFRRELFTGAEANVSHSPGINITGAFSPEGNRIALAMSKEGNSEIYLLTKDGKQLARLTTNPAIDISPSWSPDGRQIAFVSDRFGKPQIFVMSFDGSDQKRITTAGGYNVGPRWSPKGDKIAYCRQYGNGFQIHLINPDGSDDRQITTEGSNEHPRWSPDGRFIVYSSKRGGKESIYVMRNDGSGVTKISKSGANETHPAWSARW